MFPYIDIGPVHLGTFGLLLWLAAVAATVVLHKNFVRNGVDADALSVVAFVVIAGVIGAKTWHELQNVADLKFALRSMGAPGWRHPFDVVMEFLHWFQAGFAWFGGMLVGIAMLMWQGRTAKPEGLTGWKASVRMLDLAAPAAAIGYGVGRIGCLTSGDGDYGKVTTLPWGVHLRADALVPVRALVPGAAANAMVQPTPVYEFLFSLALAWLLWRLGAKARPLGWLTGLYLVLSGIGRFLVEFVRLNPRLYWGMSNAQVAALGSVVVGLVVVLATRRREVVAARVVEASS
ncbi:MAG TPA: prolipoprotein diacylglyceryl transferase family protein [Edaphobacter sp.]|jgi:phosphatidylglycerol---prolipoprotein diacylglyceryl transferase|nr:prolipoprotein diacylglyceryl transferase family protein [Edaphobacter sp.]